MSKKNAPPTVAPAPAAPRPEPRPDAPGSYSLLCTLRGHTWKQEASPRRQWTFHRCTTEGCGKIVEAQPA